MKKAILSSALVLLLTGAVLAQSGTGFPDHTISKDVTKVQNKNRVYRPAIVTTGAVPYTKGVAQLQSRKTVESKPVTFGGDNPHVISKGVARLQQK